MPIDRSFKRNEAPNIVALAMLAMILCYMMVAIKLYKLETLPPASKAAFEHYSFPQRFGLEPPSLSSDTFEKYILLNQGLALGMAVALVLVAIAAPRVGVKQPGLGLALLVFAAPLPILALV